MLKRMHTSVARKCLAEAAQSPLSNPLVHYPRWYLQRWHFLPEGYLSRRSAAGYDHVIRRLYNAWDEKHVLRALTESLRTQGPANVLELGCGPGHALQAIGASLPRATLAGVDLSPFMLERAERRLQAHSTAATLMHASALNVPIEDGAFEAVVAMHFLGHLPAKAAAGALTEAARLLAPAGRLYVVDHPWHSLPGAPPRARQTSRMNRVVRFQVLSRAEVGVPLRRLAATSSLLAGDAHAANPGTARRSP